MYKENCMSDLSTQKEEVFDYVHTSLGGGMVDVELDHIHYETVFLEIKVKINPKYLEDQLVQELVVEMVVHCSNHSIWHTQTHTY